MQLPSKYLLNGKPRVDLTVHNSIYTSELFPNNIRGKGMSIAISSYFLALIVFINSAPTAFAAIGWK